MSNPARSKGTTWESELLLRLRRMWGPDVHRAPLRGVKDDGDFVGTPFLCEAKSTSRPNFLEWARKCEEKRPKRWAIFWHGDRRKPGSGPYVLIPLELLEEEIWGPDPF